MEHLINKISEIEAAASSVINGMDKKKAGLAASIKKKREDFDQSLEEETAGQIGKLRQDMETELTKKLAEQREEASRLISHLDQIYDARHNELAETLFHQIIKE